jgi:hypothetical protein
MGGDPPAFEPFQTLKLIEVSNVDEEPSWRSPSELLARLPLEITILRDIPGADVQVYWLAEMTRPLGLAEGKSITHLVVAPMFGGDFVRAGVVTLDAGKPVLWRHIFGRRWGDIIDGGQHIAIRIGYVLDQSLVNDRELVLTKATYVATVLAEALRGQQPQDGQGGP